MRQITRLLCGMTVLALTACSGGGGGGGGGNANTPTPVATNAGGIWFGTSSSGGKTTGIEGVITEDQAGAFIDANGTQYVVTGISGDDGDIVINFNAYAQYGYQFLDGSTSGTGSITGTVDERASFSGSYSFSTGESGNMSFTYDPLYDRDSSIAKLSGQWDEGTGILIVDPDGSFFEQDSFGCVRNGQISIIDANYNAYRLTMTVSNCEGSNGAYSGLGFLSDLAAANDEDLFIVQLNSNALIFTTGLERL